MVSDLPPTVAGTVRAFIGIKLAPEIASELAKIARDLENTLVRPVVADDLHLTLVPPWQEASIGKAVETLRQATAGIVAFALDIQHVGYGPDPRRPRMLWARCASTGELDALRTALLAAYAKTDERPFYPHVTLARLRGNGRAIVRNRPMDRAVAFKQWVDSVELFRSPSPGERGYRILASVPLSEVWRPRSQC
jgi:2'-5' RNA ligase